MAQAAEAAFKEKGIDQQVAVEDLQSAMRQAQEGINQLEAKPVDHARGFIEESAPLVEQEVYRFQCAVKAAQQSYIDVVTGGHIFAGSAIDYSESGGGLNGFQVADGSWAIQCVNGVNYIYVTCSVNPFDADPAAGTPKGGHFTATYKPALARASAYPLDSPNLGIKVLGVATYDASAGTNSWEQHYFGGHIEFPRWRWLPSDNEYAIYPENVTHYASSFEQGYRAVVTH